MKEKSIQNTDLSQKQTDKVQEGEGIIRTKDSDVNKNLQLLFKSPNTSQYGSI